MAAATSVGKYAFLTQVGILPASELKARMLAGIQELADKRSTVYVKRPPHPIYRAVVSAHGSDTVENLPGEHVRDGEVTFTFQQKDHGLPSFECDHGSTADLTNSDIRVNLYHIISQIVFEHPEISLEVVQEYQRRAFRWLYMNQLALTDRGVYEERFGDFEAKTFIDVVDAHHNVKREYSMTPGSLYDGNYQLEYSDGTQLRIWLLPGISVAKELIEMGMRSERLGIECNRITAEYGVFVDGATPVAGTTLSIFDIAQQLCSNPDSKRAHPDAYEICRKVTAVKERYESEVAEMKSKTTQMNGLISKYIIGRVKGKGEKTQQQIQIEQRFEQHEQSNNALIDELMRCLNDGFGIVTPPSKLVKTFFGNFNANFDTWLESKGLSHDTTAELISEIEKLKTSDILSDAGPRHEIFTRYRIPQHALDIVIFIRKVFILSEFHNTPFYRAEPPKLEISSDQIISILRLHCRVIKKSSSPCIFIMDQVCRVCNSTSKCKSHGKTLGFNDVTTPKTGRRSHDDSSPTSSKKPRSSKSKFKGGKCITKKHKPKRRFTNTNTNKKATYTCKKYKVKVKKCKRTRRRRR